MIGYVTLGTKDMNKAAAFYDKDWREFFLPYDALEAYRATDEAREGTLAFAEKREPDFSRWR